MKIEIKEFNIIKEQELFISDDVSIIYGYNNSGKTTILKSIESSLYSKFKENQFNNEKDILFIYIPTNRVVVSEVKTNDPVFKDIEDLMVYEKNIYKNYDLHLKSIRNYLLKYDIINNYICNIIKDLFSIELQIKDGIYIGNYKYSDGIENIINIYLNIIWLLTWDIDLSSINLQQLTDYLSSMQAFILIDEIEMFLHVNIQAKLISNLKSNFSKCGFIFTTHSPLLLTRYADSKIYNIEDGKLTMLNNKLFYQDLNRIFQAYFYVDELPQELKNEINYLGNVITKKDKFDVKRIEYIEHLLENEYPSLFNKYNKAIVKAKYVGENHV